MNGPAWPRALWLVVLFLIAANARCIAAQSGPASTAPQKSTSPAPADQAPKPALEAPAKPPLSLRDRSWEILHGGLEIAVLINRNIADIEIQHRPAATM